MPLDNHITGAAATLGESIKHTKQCVREAVDAHRALGAALTKLREAQEAQAVAARRVLQLSDEIGAEMRRALEAAQAAASGAEVNVAEWEQAAASSLRGIRIPTAEEPIPTAEEPV